MTDRTGKSDWSATDAHADSDHFAKYLEKATAFDQIRAYKERSRDLLALEPGDSVLDAGCGIGDDVIALAETVGRSGRVFGIDNSEGLIREARERTEDIPHARCYVADIYDLDVADDRFDASRADRVLQHLDRPGDAMDELRRVTKPGGRIGFTDPDWASLVIDAPGSEPTHEFLDPEYAICANPQIGRRLYRLAREMGLVDVTVDSFVLDTVDFEFTFEMGELETWTDAMVADGKLEQDILDEWIERLHDAADAGRFFGAMPAYTVTGTVPN